MQAFGRRVPLGVGQKAQTGRLRCLIATIGFGRAADGSFPLGQPVCFLHRLPLPDSIFDELLNVGGHVHANFSTAFFNTSTFSVPSHGASMSVRPKWP